MHFWYVFHFCYVRFLKNINFPLGKLMFLRFLLKTHFCNFRTFFFEKWPKNPSKTKPGRLKNRCQKYVVFRHRFFRVLVSISEPLGPPSWSQVGHFGLKKLGGAPSWAFLELPGWILEAPRLAISVLEASRLDFGGSKPRFWSVQHWISATFAHIFGMFFQAILPKMPRMPEMPKMLKIC